MVVGAVGTRRTGIVGRPRSTDRAFPFTEPAGGHNIAFTAHAFPLTVAVCDPTVGILLLAWRVASLWLDRVSG